MRHHIIFDLFLKYGQYKMENDIQKYITIMVVSYICGYIIDPINNWLESEC